MVDNASWKTQTELIIFNYSIGASSIIGKKILWDAITLKSMMSMSHEPIYCQCWSSTAWKGDPC